jgi:hypothetical protein
MLAGAARAASAQAIWLWACAACWSSAGACTTKTAVPLTDAGSGAGQADTGVVAGTVADGGPAGLDVGVDFGFPLSDATRDCSYDREKLARCQAAGAFIDVTLDGKGGRYAGGCGTTECPEAPVSGGPGVDGNNPFRFTMCRAEQPERAVAVLGYDGKRFEAVLICGSTPGECATYAPKEPVAVDHASFTVTLKVRPVNFYGRDEKGSVFVPVPDAAESDLTLSVTACWD